MVDKVETPTLADLIRDPRRASELSLTMMPALLTQISVVQTAVAAQVLRMSELENAAREGRHTDRLLTVNEAANRLAVSKYWLYTHARQLPFTVRVSGRNVRFSERGIERYLRRQQAAQ